MPRTKKTYLVSVEATVTVSAGYEVQATNVDDALSNAEKLFKNELDIDLAHCHDSGFYIQDIDTAASEVE